MCSICGGARFSFRKVLWPELIAEWQLSEIETAYIDEQQGCACDACGANLRVVALGDALRQALGTESRFRLSYRRRRPRNCGFSTSMARRQYRTTLARLPLYVRGDFPAVDMHALPYRRRELRPGHSFRHARTRGAAGPRTGGVPPRSRAGRTALFHRSDHCRTADARARRPRQELPWRSVDRLGRLRRSYRIRRRRLVLRDAGGVYPCRHQSGAVSGRDTRYPPGAIILVSPGRRNPRS